MKIGVKLTIILIAISVVSIGAVGGSLLVRSRATISGLSRDYALSVARESAVEISRNPAIKQNCLKGLKI